MTAKPTKSGFFAVDTGKWADVLDMDSMNAAVAYLVLCRGTGGDNSTTSWSVHAIEAYTSISRSRAKKAVEALVSHGLIKQVKSGTRPQYKLRTGRKVEKLSNDTTIWLPNDVVTSTKSGEVSPVERIRQTGDVMLLRLFVDLYKQQNLVEDGGINQKTYRTEYRRESMGCYGQHQLYWFDYKTTSIVWNEATKPHMRVELSDDEKAQGCNKGVDAFKRFGLLETFGLIQCVPHLFESSSDEAEIIHSLGNSDQLESDIRNAAKTAALSMYAKITGQDTVVEDYEFDDSIIVPVPIHLENAQVIGIWRLRYRPHTAMTSAWWSAYKKDGNRYLKQYQNMIVTPAGNGSQATLQHQGNIKVV